MAHIVKRCSRCRRRVPAGARACECGGRVRWMARYVDPEGVERAQVFERQQDAEDFLAIIETDKAAGEYRDPKAGRETLRSVYLRFCSETSLEPTTRAKWDGVWGITSSRDWVRRPWRRSSQRRHRDQRRAGEPVAGERGRQARQARALLCDRRRDPATNVAARVKLRQVQRRDIEILEPANWIRSWTL